LLYLGATRDRLISKRTVADLKVLRPDLECVMLEAPHFLLQRAPAEAVGAIAGYLARRRILEAASGQTGM
jgi:hypothetical protein